jgi:hypothetical protein
MPAEGKCKPDWIHYAFATAVGVLFVALIATLDTWVH